MTETHSVLATHPGRPAPRGGLSFTDSSSARCPADDPTVPPPIIGITPDLYLRDGRPTVRVSPLYAQRVQAAGGLPVILPPPTDPAADPAAQARRYAEVCDALVLSGGDDPITEPFGEPTHPAAVRVLPERQAFELPLLDAFTDRPVLGVCLGMQYMALARGGRLDQHLPDGRLIDPATAARHWDADHPIIAEQHAPLVGGVSHSRHRQAVADPGSLRVAAHADDGLIEAIFDPNARFYLGVQWHPERTTSRELGQDLFDRLVAASRAR